MSTTPLTFFAPQLLIPSGTTDTSFYQNAFGAIEIRSFKNANGSIHVSELAIDGALFHLHEEKKQAGRFSAGEIKGTTVLIGLFVADVDAVVNKAVAAGAMVISAPTTFDYGYRQAEVKDPFGHTWLIEMRVATDSDEKI